MTSEHKTESGRGKKRRWKGAGGAGGKEVAAGGRFLLCHLISLTSELNDGMNETKKKTTKTKLETEAPLFLKYYSLTLFDCLWAI